MGKARSAKHEGSRRRMIGNRPSASYAILAGGSAFLCLASYAVSNQVEATPPSSVSLEFFESKIRPVLQAKCVGCHGPQMQAGNIRLDKPISASEAAKVARAVSFEGVIKMPPTGKLPSQDLTALATWAKSGAPWPVTPKSASKPKGRFWSFVPPKTPAIPKVEARWWAQNPVDAFVLAKLEEAGLKPSPPADRRTLIRRATFDLTGLPPTPEEVDAFLADKEPNAFARVVDRLLASPAYGERWGRHWLDVARYADSNGLDENLVYPNAWRYRDWVIASINEDKPIDRFFQEQVAGDLLPDAGDEGVVATGYLALGAKMLAEDDPVKQELDVIDEQVDTLTKSFLGLTVGCARCHDHKFDPISAKDYYAMAGIFKSTKTMLNYKNMAEWNEQPLGPKADREKLMAIDLQIRSKTEAVNKKRSAAGEILLKQLRLQAPAYEKAARELLARDANRAPIQPVIHMSDERPPADAIVREAEDYVTGNVNKDKGAFGKEIGVLVNRGEYPNVAEYEITVSSAGPFQLDLRYASGDSRPFRVFANGTLVLPKAGGQVSGGFLPEHQKWFAEGVIVLQAGANRIKFERDSYFPHIDKLLLLPRPGQQPTESLDLIAREAGLAPAVVQDVAQRIKNGIDISIELPESFDHLLPHDVAGDLKQLGDEIAALKKEKPNLPLAMAVSEGKPTDMKVHLRGSYLTLGEDSPRKFPVAVAGPNQRNLPKDRSGRLELAKWLTDAKNPLTARVFVNRVWRWRFGRGLVGSVDNFGALGDLPTHPELLDYLATTFVSEDRWSLKKLHRRLMLTNTYVMSGRFEAKAAAIDPDNRLLWRFPRQRLGAEAIRDSILFVTETLDRTMGGTLMNLPPRSYVTSTANADPVKYDSLRRAVYLPIIRSALYDVYTAFDFGDPTVMNGDRSSTTVAPQALFMLNSPIVLNATRSHAQAILKRTDLDDAGRVRQLYLKCFGRPATQAEVTRSLQFLTRFQSAYAKSNDPRSNAWQSLCKSLIASNEFVYVE